jgi:hypothetical protein
MKRFVIFGLLAFVASACTGTEDTSDSLDGPTNYHRDIAPLIAENCLSCHQEGGIGLYSFETASEVESMAVPIVTAVENRTMPPWGHDPDCRPTSDSLWLDDEIIDVFLDWREQEYLIGTASEGSPGLGLPDDTGEKSSPEEADILLETDQAYVPDVGFSDDYRCLILPHEFQEDTFVYESFVFPERLDLVHHVIVYVASAEYRSYFEDLDAETETMGFPCFGGTGVDDAQMLVGWAPGAFAAKGDRDFARLVPKDSVLVMQMHFNLAGKTVDDVVDGDRTQVALWTLDEGETPSYLTTLMPVFDFGIDIPPGEDFWPEVSTRRLPVKSEIIGTAPHMHLLGKSIETILIRPDGTEECLTKVDQWDFDWQRSYVYPEDHTVSVSIEDTIRLECVYDNSADNQPVIAGEKLEPRQVTWGDGTTDEMCLNYLVLATPFVSEGETGICAGYQGCQDTCPEGDALCPISCAGSLGIPCLECNVDGLFSSCAQQQCGLPMLNFGSCYDSCSGDDLFDFFDCIHGPCQQEFETFHDCLEPYLEDGTCESDYSSCTGMFVE